jgi:hypothetical protein
MNEMTKYHYLGKIPYLVGTVMKLINNKIIYLIANQAQRQNFHLGISILSVVHCTFFLSFI